MFWMLIEKLIFEDEKRNGKQKQGVLRQPAANEDEQKKDWNVIWNKMAGNETIGRRKKLVLCKQQK